MSDIDESGSGSDLAARASGGDRQALGLLLARHLPSLQAYVRLKAGPVLRARESLSDLVQSVCVEVLQDLPGFEFRGEARFRHWLFQHALHKVVNKANYHRAQKRDLGRERAMPAGDSASGEHASVLACYASICTPSRHASGREALARFEAAFDRLPDDYREAITLQRLVGMPYAEIAAAMGRSEGAVRNLVHRGLARLTTLLE